MSETALPLPPGLWGVLATPFRNGGADVDVDSLCAQVRLYLDLGAAGLVALGVFGEGSSLDSGEQRSVVRAVRAEAGDTPVVVGLSALATAPAIEQARTIMAEEVAPTALMVQVNSADPGTVRRHFDAVHAATQIPLVVQDYPAASGVRITSRALLGALREMPYVAAVKSEAPPTALAIAQLTSEIPASVFGGLGGVGLLDELAAGAAGVMTGFSHPEGLRATLDAWYTSGGDAARAAFQRWLPLVNFEAQPGIGLAIRKEILYRRGLLRDPAVRTPNPAMPAQLHPLATGHLNALNPQ